MGAKLKILDAHCNWYLSNNVNCDLLSCAQEREFWKVCMHWDFQTKTAMGVKLKILDAHCNWYLSNNINCDLLSCAQERKFWEFVCIEISKRSLQWVQNGSLIGGVNFQPCGDALSHTHWRPLRSWCTIKQSVHDRLNSQWRGDYNTVSWICFFLLIISSPIMSQWRGAE